LSLDRWGCMKVLSMRFYLSWATQHFCQALIETDLCSLIYLFAQTTIISETFQTPSAESFAQLDVKPTLMSTIIFSPMFLIETARSVPSYKLLLGLDSGVKEVFLVESEKHRPHHLDSHLSPDRSCRPACSSASEGYSPEYYPPSNGQYGISKSQKAMAR